jgi:hypothetical protein
MDGSRVPVHRTGDDPSLVRAYEAWPEVRSSGVPDKHLTDARGVFQHGDRRSRWP